MLGGLFWALFVIFGALLSVILEFYIIWVLVFLSWFVGSVGVCWKGLFLGGLGAF